MYSETKIIDEIIEKWGEVVIPFIGHLRSSPRGVSRAEAFGSGFFVTYENLYVLVTAAHVIKKAHAYKHLALNICGKAVIIENKSFLVDEDSDLCIAFFFDFELAASGVERIKTADLFSEELGTAVNERYVGMGYPSSVNKLDSGYGKTKRTCLAFSVFRAPDEVLPPTRISTPLIFLYNEEEMIPGMNRPEKSNPPDLHGVSGGPLFRVYCRDTHNDDGSNYRVGLRLVGVLVERHLDHNCLVVTKRDRVVELIERTIMNFRTALKTS